MPNVDVALFMGSNSDWKHLQKAVGLLHDLEIATRIHVSSAHRTPARTIDLVKEAESDGCRVFICAAGMAAHLAGAVAANTHRPVLGIPLPGGVLDGVDALLSTVQMPGGVPVATFAVGSAGAKNAAIFAAQILAADRPELEKTLLKMREEDHLKVLEAERTVLASID